MPIKRGGFNNVPKFLAALKKGLGDGLDDLGRGALNVIDREFETETTATGEEWAPLKPATIRKTGPDILQDTGSLRESYDYEVSRMKGEVKVYTEHPVAPIHEFGVPDQNIPRRPVLGPAAEYAASEGFEQEFRPAVHDAIEGSLKARMR